MTKNLPYLVVVGLVVLYLIVEMTRPRPLDNRLLLRPNGTQPFDAKVLVDLLPEWTGEPVRSVVEPPYLALDSEATPAAYVFLTETFEPDRAETQRLLRFVREGGTLLLAVQNLSGPLADSLGTVRPADSTESETVGRALSMSWTSSFAEDSTLALIAPGVRGAYRFPFGFGTKRIVHVDTGRTTVLGTAAPFIEGQSVRTEKDDVTLVRVAVGEGEVIVSSTPRAFTNAAIVGEGGGADYVAGVLGYLSPGPIWFDTSHLSSQGEMRTSLRVILQSEALRWAYGLFLLGGLLLVVMLGRRRQRPIPVMESPPNAEREFARTIGRLQFLQSTPQRLVERKGRILLDQVRSRLHLTEARLDEETATHVARRAGVPEEEVVSLFGRLQRLPSQRTISDDALLTLDRDAHRLFRHLDAPDPSSEGAVEHPPGAPASSDLTLTPADA